MIGLKTKGDSWIYKKSMFENHDGDAAESGGKGSNKPNFDSEDITAVYIRAIYFIITTLTTVGYGDFKGFTNNEYLFQMAVEFIGIGFFSFLMGSINSILV